MLYCEYNLQIILGVAIAYKNDIFQENVEYSRSNSFPEIDYATENYIFKVFLILFTFE